MTTIKPMLLIITVAAFLLSGCGSAPNQPLKATVAKTKAADAPATALMLVEASRSLDQMVGQKIQVVACNPRIETNYTINMDGSGAYLSDETGALLLVRNYKALASACSDNLTEIVRSAFVTGTVVKRQGVTDKRFTYALEIQSFDVTTGYPSRILVRRDLITALEASEPKGPDSGLQVRLIETLAGVGNVYTFTARVVSNTLAGPREEVVTGTFDVSARSLGDLTRSPGTRR
ncbi:MAG TPA: hypothetical protein V6D05_03000 [Stenomitos sp.]